jgi:hypothetical protein
MRARRISRDRKWILGALGALVALGAPPGIFAAEKVVEVDATTRKELQAMESRFAEAIQKRDDRTLSEILADYYADSVGDEERAASKRLVLARARTGTLVSYPIEKELRFTVSAETYTIEGEAKSPPRLVTDEPVKIKWVQVRRIWIKKDGHWLLILQNIRDEEEEKSKEQKK